MGFRFFRRIKLAPGVTLNLSKSGGSLSFGPRGAKFTVGPRGQRATVGIPGTGIFYTTTFGKNRSQEQVRKSRPAPTLTVREADRLNMGFFKRLITPDDHEALIDGWREIILGNEETALEHLQKATHLADGAFLAGTLSLKRAAFPEAVAFLTTAAKQTKQLGSIFSKYAVSVTVSIAITEEVSAHVGPDIRGVLLVLAEAYQAQGQWSEAIACLERLRKLEPEDDVVVKLSLAELLIETGPQKRSPYQEVVQFTEGIANESPVHTALLMYKAKALRGLGLREAALEVLSGLLRKRKYPEELLRALRYEQAVLYEEGGQEQRARAEWEKLYAEAPDYEDVAVRLGM